MRTAPGIRIVGLVGLMGLIGLMGCGPSAQERYAHSLLPAHLALKQAPVEKAAEARAVRAHRTFRVRAYATIDYRIEVREWQRRFRTLIERVNRLLGPAYGVQLEAEELRTWDRRSGDASMDALLDEIEKLDAGDGVDWVVGLITAEPRVSSSLHTLGMARLLGRHFVMRNLDDIGEYQALARVLDEIPRKQRDGLYTDRKQHKELVIFLHEWGHTLGAMHISEDKSLMNPSYDEGQIDFSEANARVLEIGLRHREESDRNAAWRPDWLRELREYLAGHDDADWDRASRREILARTGASAGAAPAAAATPASPSPAGPDGEAFARAAQLSMATDYIGAFALVRPLIPRFEKDSRLQRFACQVGCRVGEDPALLRQLCDNAASLVPSDPTPYFFLAEAQLAKKDTAAAQSTLARAEARLAGDAKMRRTQIEMLAALYQRVLLPSAAERAARRVNNQKIIGWATTARRFHAIPQNAAALGLPVEREGEYINLAARAGELAWNGAPEAARAAIAELRTAFSSLPAAPLRQCELDLRLENLAAARLACEQALAIQEDAVTAHLHLGQIAERQRRTADATAHLERALELDPSTEIAWTALAGLYRQTHKAAKLARLRAWYEDRFQTPMK